MRLLLISLLYYFIFIPFANAGAEVQVGGYAKLDIVFSSVSAGSNSIGDEFIVNALLPTQSEGEEDQLKFTARESRVWLKGGTSSEQLPVRFYLEGDFFGNKPASSETLNNNSDFRLRQAFAEVTTPSHGRFLMGQAWTTLQNLKAFPHSTTLGTLPGQVFSRVPMIRWTSNTGQLQLAMENPETQLRDINNTSIKPDDDRLPDIVLRLNLEQHSLSILVRQLRCDMVPSCDDSTYGQALSLAGRFTLSAADSLRYQFHFGKGLGRFVSGAVFPGAQVDALGQIDAVEVQAALLSLQHAWSDQWKSALIFNRADANNVEGIENTTKSVVTININTVWFPIKSLRFGLELIRAERETVSSIKGDLTRVIVSSKFSF
ncbi:MAG: hypothetical protein KUG80_03140 [Gammaproteobacteria bacterium]|nr:hypothetical protein [Gammaproteobacteria bacterium]